MIATTLQLYARIALAIDEAHPPVLLAHLGKQFLMWESNQCSLCGGSPAARVKVIKRQGLSYMPINYETDRCRQHVDAQYHDPIYPSPNP